MSIKALIVEDEKPAAEHLVRLLGESEHEVKVLHKTDSISQTIAWLKSNPLPDIIFLDIQLADGLSFEIFKHLEIQCPVIFTTAFEEYAIRAFKLNSIDYLLKPIGIEELSFALGKFMGQTLQASPDSLLSNKVETLLQMLNHPYKSRFIVNVGPRIKFIESGHIKYFYSLEKSTYLLEDSGKSYDISYSLDQVETQLDPKLFFRISRKYIVSIEAIQEIITYSSSRLKLIIKDSDQEDILVSRSKINDFKSWLER
ncbi:MAG: LytTR family DNA-binding domain-containing protein [Bacteroidota bacterium]|nr:LytTR family DNA-binding domain-containing protein [Bacteroidota bacterium]